MTKHIDDYMDNIQASIEKLDKNALNNAIECLISLRQREGRLFIIGVGGSAANAAHAVNDFRKICRIQAYAPTDNVAELTARINDQGWDGVFESWLKCSRLTSKDAVMIFSVGGGSLEHQLSVNLIHALKLANQCKASSIAIVGRDGGYCAGHAQHLLLIPSMNSALTTAISESMQAVVWHAMVSDPRLCENTMKWESLEK